VIRFVRPPAPARPVSIELAAGVTIGEGLFGIITSAMAPQVPDASSAGIVGASIALQLLGILVGLLIRSGRAWIVGLNVAAIYAFLYLSAFPDPVSILLGLGQLFIVGALSFGPNRAWFDAMGEWRATPGSEAQASPDAADARDGDGDGTTDGDGAA
jgi:hypothetical protein